MIIKTITLLSLLSLLFIIHLPKPINAKWIEQHDDQGKLLHSRQRRAASYDFVGKIKSSITSSIGKASASFVGGASSGSSSKTYAYEKPVEKDVHFDGWELKKSILNTLFQAVKAITGGITAINGQLIKGSGYALSHGGKLITASGDAVTNVGKKIALSAKLLPADKPHYAKYFGSSSHSGHDVEDFTSFGHDGLVEYAQPHDLTAYVPEPHVPFIPVEEAYHYPAPPISHNQYGLPPVGSPHSHIVTNYISTDRKAQSYDKLDTTPLTGPETFDTISTNQVASQKAVEALQQLLRKLPNKLTHKDSINSLHATVDHSDDKQHIKQYNLPSDPVQIPSFKPIKSAITSTYTLQLGPIESKTKHTYGGSRNVGAGVTTITGPKTKLVIKSPPSKFTLSAHLVPPPPPPPPPQTDTNSQIQEHFSTADHSNQALSTQPLDLYHTMTLKNSVNAPQTSILYVPPVNQQQFEIQRSIQYQLH